MFHNVGGAVLGVAVLTFISDSMALMHGGNGDMQAILEGYRAGYYDAISMVAIGLVSFSFAHTKQEKQQQQQNRNQETKDERDENGDDG